MTGMPSLPPANASQWWALYYALVCGGLILVLVVPIWVWWERLCARRQRRARKKLQKGA